jgi:outer membrane protein, heavy metal efflux system
MRIRILSLCVLFPLFPFGGLLSGGTFVPQEKHSLSLAEARAAALERNWDLLAVRSDLDLAEAQRLIARALPNPQLQATLQKLGIGGPALGPPTDRTRDTIVAVSQLIEVGGKRRARVHSATAGIAAAQAQFDFARARLDAAVIKAYVAARTAEENVRVGRLSATSLSRSAEIATHRLEAGEISEAERDQVAIAAGRFEADTQTAEAAVVQNRSALETLLGMSRFDPDLALADDMSALLDLAALAQNGNEERTVETRGDVRAAAAAVEGAEADATLQRALRWPDPTFQAQYEDDQSAADAHSVGVGISLPIPLFNRNQGGVRAADVALQAARRRLEQARAQGTAEMATARAAFDAARKRRALLAGTLMPRAEKVQQTIAFAYEKGGASLLELLEAERNLNELRLAALGSEAEFLSAAADLAAASGDTLK